MKILKKIALILIILAVVMMAGAFVAPKFLLHSTPYEKSDAIVLLLGPDFSARQRHAQDLMQKGMSDYLIIPAYHRAYVNDQGVIRKVTTIAGKNVRNGKSTATGPYYFEDTHLELIEARKTMELHGKKTAIFVSSPYHMRRIQLIVNRVYGNKDPYYFSPTPYESVPENFWQFKPSDWKKVWREYLKISWFMIYSLWSDSNSK